MSTRTIVIVEDEPDIADILALYVQREGWTASIATDGHRALEVIRARQPDMVLLDIGLPGPLDGTDVCRELRRFSDVPVMFLTARDDEVDRILGLQLGADDYVTKPFSAREVIARVKAILRRGERTEPARAGNATPIAATFGSIIIDGARREVTVDGAPIELAAQEFALLDHLVRNTGIALSRQQILDGAWGEGWIGDIRTVDVHIRQLRKKLGDDLPLDTVRGVGYRLG